MLFLVRAHDHPGRLAVRMETRPVHLAYLVAHPEVVRLGGAALGGPDGTPDGSMLILEARDEAAARAFLADDPYAKAGLFAHIDVVPWRQAVGPGLA